MPSVWSGSLASLLTALALAAPAAGTVVLRLDPGRFFHDPGDLFAVDLLADLSDPVLGFGLDLHFDPEVVAPVGDPTIGPDWFPVTAPDGDGLAGAAFPAGVVGDGVQLVTLTFEALSAGDAGFWMGFTPGDLTEGFALDPFGRDTVVYESAPRVQVVPEPSTALLLALGLAGIASLRARRPGRTAVTGLALLLGGVTDATADADAACRVSVRLVTMEGPVEPPTADVPCPASLAATGGGELATGAADVGSAAAEATGQAAAGLDLQNATIDSSVDELYFRVSGPGASVEAPLVVDVEFAVAAVRPTVALPGGNLTSQTHVSFAARVDGNPALNGVLEYTKGWDAYGAPTQTVGGVYGFLAPYVCPITPIEEDATSCSMSDTVLSDPVVLPVGTAFPVRLEAHGYIALTNDAGEADSFARMTLGDGVFALPEGYTLTLADGSAVPSFSPVPMAEQQDVPVLSGWGLALLAGVLGASAARRIA
jgi:hypothetical protein